MQAPIRFLYSVGRNAPTSILVATAAITSMFSATPFLLAALSDLYAVSEGVAGWISTVQVGTFAVANLVLPRYLVPTARVFRVSVVLFAIANAASAVAINFPILLGWRAIAGAAAGALTWIAWADAMRTPRSMSSVSSIGPLTAFVAAPLMAFLAGWSVAVVYMTLAAFGIAAMAATPPQPASRNTRREVSGSRSNRVLLFALALMTFAGASLFVYAAVAAAAVYAMSATVASFAFSLNALAGLAGARLARRTKRPGVWLATCGVAASLTVLGGSPWLFYLGMAWWGFAFWMGVPGVLQMLAARSLARDERAGDAQGLMAVGRTFGPAAGGIFADQSAFGALAVASGVGMVLAGVSVMGVQEGRERLPVSDPRTVIEEPTG